MRSANPSRIIPYMDSETNSPENLKQRRNAAHLSLEAVAAHMDVHATTLWRWEKGDTRINKHLLALWVSALESLAKKAIEEAEQEAT